MSDKLIRLMVLCAKNNVEFHYLMEGDVNSIEFIDGDVKKLISKIPFHDDKGLEKLIDDKYDELNELFK